MFSDRRRVERFLSHGLTEVDVAVLGDIMLDRYLFGAVERISPEAPVPITRVTGKRDTLGGAANVAHNLSRLGCRVRLLGLVGDDENWPRLRQLLEQQAIDRRAVIDEPGRATTAKLRIIGGHQQMLRVDFEDSRELSAESGNRLLAALETQLASGVQVLIISDYGKGVCSRQLCRRAIDLARGRSCPVLVDPKGSDWRKYERAFAVTPNVRELGEVLGCRLSAADGQGLVDGGLKVCRRHRLGNLIVTRAEYGMSVISRRRHWHIPTRAQEVYDVSGAGDTVVAVLAAALAAGLPLSDAAELANLAAGVVVGRVGTYAISRQELIARMEGNWQC
ncbi:MAG: D-glycero-beta-D-manno-heptose-7-phosphate kinase [Negativicutes bacterium]|nr:D-glycero-beta-D-manno-heptose-7-phosphate kinase [Negativicutes bacterium]